MLLGVCACVCLNFFFLFSYAKRAKDTKPHTTRSLTPHSIHIFILFGLWQALPTTLAPPTITTFLLPPARLNFRNLLNLLPIDFPPEFTLLLKIQRIKKRRYPLHQCGYIHILPHSCGFTLKYDCKIHTYCTHTCTHPDTHTLGKLWRPLLIVFGF